MEKRKRPVNAGSASNDAWSVITPCRTARSASKTARNVLGMTSRNRYNGSSLERLHRDGGRKTARPRYIRSGQEILSQLHLLLSLYPLRQPLFAHQPLAPRKLVVLTRRKPSHSTTVQLWSGRFLRSLKSPQRPSNSTRAYSQTHWLMRIGQNGGTV